MRDGASERSAEQGSLLAAVADELPVGLWVARAPDGERVYANRMFTEIMGDRPGVELSCAHGAPRALYGRDGRPYPEHRVPFLRALRTRATVEVDDIVVHHRDGRRVFIRAFARPLFDGRGEISHVAVALEDYSAQVAVDGARKQAEDRLRRIVETAPMILWATDREGTVTLAEGAALAALGVRPEQAVGMKAAEVLPRIASVGETLGRALRGESFSTSGPVGDRHLETRLCPVMEEGDRLAGVVGVSWDVTDRVRAQERLVHATRMATVGTMAASVGHEVNSPLTYLMANLDLIDADLAAVQGGDLGRLERIRAAVAEARQGARRVAAISRELASFSRLEQDQPRSVALPQVVDAAVRISWPLVRSRARLEVRHRAEVTVRADPTRLEQVVVNLLVNAAQAMPASRDGEALIEVHTGTYSEGEAFIEVRDNGEGIRPEHLARVFDPFFTTKPGGLGTGLGLAVSQDLVQAMGGEIQVQSAPGEGATFRVILPAPGRARTLSRETAAASPCEARAATLPRVLVVDDDERIGRVFTLALSQIAEVRFAHGGGPALRALAEAPFDLILCDMMMAPVSGMDVYRTLARDLPELEPRFILMSGGACTPEARAFLETFPRPFVQKPFDVREVVEAHLRARARAP